jgi:protein FAM32A
LPEGVDRRTAAEKRYDAMMAKREAEQSQKAALKSHRERVNEFNTYLQNLSEHHDIPRWAFCGTCCCCSDCASFNG